LLLLDGGDIVVPLVAGYTFLNDLEIPVINIERVIQWGNPLTTDTATVLLLAKPAPGNIPTVLH